ncbi:MAG: GDSL-type esterase/lipase family protein [Proteobacteria bacterium]|nr:GDSL-type esterase/lipase family protein [Pseudomonadota bacterium]
MATILPQIRVGFIGDSITHGTGDETLLGWPTRVAQAARADGYDVVPYNLGVRADTSELVAARWEAECDARLPEPFKRATVFAVGINDSAHEKSPQRDGARVELERSTELIIRMIKTARRFGPSLWVGPTPVIEAMMPLTPFKGLSYRFANDAIARHNEAYAARAAAEGIAYLDLFTPLSADPGWEASLRTTDGLHPGSGGYALMARRFASWPAWQVVLADLKR